MNRIKNQQSELVEKNNFESELNEISKLLNNFKTAADEVLPVKRLIEEIKSFILFDQRFHYRVLIGTDSENQDQDVDFVSAIVVHRVGQGARYFWRRQVIAKRLELHHRLWQEALISLEISKALIKILTLEKLNFSFELHLDLGYNGKSESVIKELIALVRGYGFDVKVKPSSCAASTIADRLV